MSAFQLKLRVPHAGASTASLIPLKIGGEGLVVESSVAHVSWPGHLCCVCFSFCAHRSISTGARLCVPLRAVMLLSKHASAQAPPFSHHPSLQGTRRELLRALCQLVNTTELTLEAALIEVEDSDWHMVAARSGEGQIISGGAAAEVGQLVVGLGRSARLAGCTLVSASLGRQAVISVCWQGPDAGLE